MKDFLKEWGVTILCSAVGLTIGMLFWSGKYSPVSINKRIDQLEKNQKVLVTEINQQRDDMEDLYQNQKNLKERVDQSFIITVPGNAVPSGAPHDWMNGAPEQQVPISPVDGRY